MVCEFLICFVKEFMNILVFDNDGENNDNGNDDHEDDVDDGNDSDDNDSNDLDKNRNSNDD